MNILRCERSEFPDYHKCFTFIYNFINDAVTRVVMEYQPSLFFKLLCKQ
jgi:hypothetical protein